MKILERVLLPTRSTPRLGRRFHSALLLASCCVTPAFATANSQPQPALENPVFQALPLERSKQNHLLVRAEINGKPALLGVDSGAPVSAISASRRAYFGMSAVAERFQTSIPLRINGGFDRVRIAHRLRLGALTLLDEPMVTIDLSAPARAARAFHEQELDGILGADILFPTQAVLDCDAQTLFMKIDPDMPGSMPGVNHRGWKDVPIRVSKGWNLYVDSKLNGKAAQLMIDTGAFTTLIHRPFVQANAAPAARYALRFRCGQSQAARFAAGDHPPFRGRKFLVKGKEVGVMDLRGLIHGDLLEGRAAGRGIVRLGIPPPQSRHHRFWHAHALFETVANRIAGILGDFNARVQSAGRDEIQAANLSVANREKSNASRRHSCHWSEMKLTLVLLPARLLPWPGECSRPGRQQTARKETDGDKSKTSGRAQDQRRRNGSGILAGSRARRRSPILRNWRAQGFYDGTAFHRIMRGFMIQGGDPNTKDPSKEASYGTGGPGYSIPAEFNDRPHLRGVLSMARSADPNSAGSQFFICLGTVSSARPPIHRLRQSDQRS